MNKYFAQYLPVEGEPKEGETAFSPNNCTAMYYKGVEGTWRKAKLFLCSRDIQVGDEWYGHDNEKVTSLATQEVIDNLSSSIGNKNAFKIIGEISPEALEYVKEGDEFSEDQVQYWPLKGGTVPSYRIKGPCGHFH